MPYSLRRTRDGAGDSGPMSRSFVRLSGKWEDVGPRPTVGAIIQVGSAGSRTYSWQDYWQTTPITEILEEREDYVRFKTNNSEYIWERF